MKLLCTDITSGRNVKKNNNGLEFIFIIFTIQYYNKHQEVAQQAKKSVTDKYHLQQSTSVKLIFIQCKFCLF